MAAAAKKAEEEKELARARRLEARQKKEEADREKRENAREQRRLEREAKEEQARLRDEAKTKETRYAFLDLAQQCHSHFSCSVDVDVVGTTAPHLPSSVDPGRRSYSSATGSSSSVGANGRWELDCEGCQRRGVNLVGAWLEKSLAQTYIDCSTGRWPTDDFLCSMCETAARDMPRHHGSGRRPSPTRLAARRFSLPAVPLSCAASANKFKYLSGYSTSTCDKWPRKALRPRSLAGAKAGRQSHREHTVSPSHAVWLESQSTSSQFLSLWPTYYQPCHTQHACARSSDRPA